MNINNVLIFGNGPVALHIYLILRKQGIKNIALKIRDSLKSRNFYKELQEEQFILEGKSQKDLPDGSYGKVEVETVLRKNGDVMDEWEYFILATPCDTYLSILRNISFFSLNKLKRILLVSPEFGSAYFIKSMLKEMGRNDVEVISFSNYFGATNFLKGFYTKILINALKEKIFISSTELGDIEIEKWKDILKNIGITTISCRNSLVAESKNITVFVHSPFLFNEVSLNQIFLKDLQKRYIYKLYPEGPITKYLIEDMVELYHEIMELYQKMGIETFNLLEFLNENYPVLDYSIHSDEIKDFMKKRRKEQSFLIYTRYCCILIDPYSTPDIEGRYFDFSKVEYSKIFLNKDKKWCIPRRPAEDYTKLNLLFYLSQRYQIRNITMRKLLDKYRSYFNEFRLENSIETIEECSIPMERNIDAEDLYRYVERLDGN